MRASQFHTRASATLRDPRWRLLIDSRTDSGNVAAAQHSAFVYAVRTTGVYCRPGCSARLPRPENVTFYDTARDAESAGFRPCQRCRPSTTETANPQLSWVVRLCRAIERDAAVDVQTMAEAYGISPSHLSRQFKRFTGLTPARYAHALQGTKVREQLPLASSVTTAIFDTGFSSTGRFYERGPAMLGMTPSAYRGRGRGETIAFAVGQSSLGAVLIGSSARGICHIALGDEPEPLLEEFQHRFAEAELIGGDAAFEQQVAQVVGLIEAPGQNGSHALPLDIRGTVFQARVWQALTAIPPGTTATYADIAARIGAPKAARAVAAACAANHLAVLIPCHRVVRTDGTLSGYRWGIERKRRLLSQEQTSPP